MYGLPSQRAACGKRAQERGWTIVREITDDVTGSDTFRPGLTELRRAVAAGEADTVLIYSVDRLSRNTVDVLTLMAELRGHAVVEFVAESFDDNPAGRLFLALRASIGAFEREQIMQRTQAGRIAKARSGLVPGGRAPYGYRMVDGTFVIHDEEAAVVRQVYNWAENGISQREIARRLNERGVKPYGKTSWSKASVGRVLGHEVYIGIAIYNARKRKRKKSGPQPRPIDEHIEIPVPPIVTREIYDAVVIARAVNQEMRVGRPSRDYMLTSILRCSCGKRMCGDQGLYRCTRRTDERGRPRKKECKTRVSARFLDELVWNGYVELFLDPVKLKQQFVAQHDLVLSLYAKKSGERILIEEKITKLVAREKRTLDMMVELESAEDRAVLKAKRDETRAERIRLQAALKAMAPAATMPDADELSQRMRASSMKRTTAISRRQELRRCGLEIHWDGYHATIKITGGPELEPPENSPTSSGDRSAHHAPAGEHHAPDGPPAQVPGGSQPARAGLHHRDIRIHRPGVRLGARAARHPAQSRPHAEGPGRRRGGRRTGRLAQAAVSAQVALSLLLLIGAGLFTRSLANLQDLRPGFEVHNLLSFSVDPTLNGYKTERATFFYRQLTQGLAAQPGAQSAALALVPPLSFDDWDSDFSVEGYATKAGEDMNSHENYVSPGFFGTLKIPLEAGRDFTARDSIGAPKVAVVNRKFARRYFGGRDPVGRHIGNDTDPGTKTDIEIVGVVGDTKYETIRDEIPRQVFFPYLQRGRSGNMTAYVRTDVPPNQMFPVLRAAVRKLDANLPVYLMKTVERQRDDSLSVDRLAATLATAFGVLATLLAAIGLYGVMAFLVARRTREIGLRMALGALTGNVIWLVVREVLLLAGIGVLVGLPVSLAVLRLLASLLYGVNPNDTVSIVVATLGIAAIAAVSGYIPARRATRVDPVTALRYE